MHTRRTHLSGTNFINPARDDGLGKYQRALLEVLDVFLDALFQLRELQEVDVVHHFQSLVLRVRVLDDVAELWRGKSEHPTVGMVEDSNLACAEKALGDDDGAQGILAAWLSEDASE